MRRDEYALFAAIVESGSLSGAARLLKLSASMVSKRLSALERRLGAQLVQRTTRRLSLTDVGEIFYERVAAILAASSEAEAMVAGRAGAPAGRLRISAPTSFGRLHVAPHLKDFLDLYPAITLEIDLADRYVDILAERIDVAIRIGPPPDRALSATRLAPNRRLLCAAPGYLERFGRPKHPTDLRAHRLLAAAGQLPWRLDGPEGPILIDGEPFVRTNSSEVVRELTLCGAGIALRSTWDVASELRDGRLLPLLPGYEGAAEIGIHAVRPAGELIPPSVQAFIDFFKTIYSPTPPWERGAEFD